MLCRWKKVHCNFAKIDHFRFYYLFIIISFVYQFITKQSRFRVDKNILAFIGISFKVFIKRCYMYLQLVGQCCLHDVSSPSINVHIFVIPGYSGPLSSGHWFPPGWSPWPHHATAWSRLPNPGRRTHWPGSDPQRNDLDVERRKINALLNHV